jgi:hypothetical protein
MSGDFLCKGAKTLLCEHYTTAGAVLRLSTNSEQLLEAARIAFLVGEARTGSIDLSVRFWVDDLNPTEPPWPNPYVRGLDHLVFAGFDSANSMLADLRTHRVIGRFSAGMAADTNYWTTTIFPMLLTIVGASIGIVELHSASVAIDGSGLLLAGPSQAGKSTLAYALARMGFNFLADDRTLCSLRDGSLLACATSSHLKLRPEAGRWFDEFEGRSPTDKQNGRAVFRLEPERLGLRRVRQCRPRLFVFLERQQASAFELTGVGSNEAARLIERDLLAEPPEFAQRQKETINRLAKLPCYRLRYGGPPQAIARELAHFFDNSKSS